MITAMHGVFHTSEAEQARAFFRDVLGLRHVDAGRGWLIFHVPKAEFGIHPGDGPRHEISFCCDDIAATRQELEAKGATFSTPVTDQGFGLVTTMQVPGGLEVLLYEPRHAQPEGA